jgi:hypothetical protein
MYNQHVSCSFLARLDCCLDGLSSDLTFVEQLYRKLRGNFAVDSAVRVPMIRLYSNHSPISWLKL